MRQDNQQANDMRRDANGEARFSMSDVGPTGGAATPAAYKPSPRTRAQSAWSAVARRYDALAGALTAQAVDRLMRAGAVAPEARVLDLCAGPGAATAAAHALGADALGVDFSPAMIAAARARHPNAPFRIGDVLALDVRADFFDTVLCNFGLPLLEGPERALAEANRALRPGGRLVWTAWAGPDRNPFLATATAAVIKEPPLLFRYGDLAAAEAATRAAGFVDIAVAPFEVEIDVASDDILSLLRSLEPDIDRAAAHAPDGGDALAATLARALSAFAQDGRLRAPAVALLVTGRKMGGTPAQEAARVTPAPTHAAPTSAASPPDAAPASTFVPAGAAPMGAPELSGGASPSFETVPVAPTPVAPAAASDLVPASQEAAAESATSSLIEPSLPEAEAVAQNPAAAPAPGPHWSRALAAPAAAPAAAATSDASSSAVTPDEGTAPAASEGAASAGDAPSSPPSSSSPPEGAREASQPLTDEDAAKRRRAHQGFGVVRRLLGGRRD